MATTVSEQCKCGAQFTVQTRSYANAWLLHSVFTSRHGNCITLESDDAEEGPGGDVFTQTQLAEPTTEPELVTGFQRVVW